MFSVIIFLNFVGQIFCKKNYNGAACSAASDCISSRCVKNICRGGLTNVLESCIQECESINTACIREQSRNGKEFCDNIILNNCLPACGGFCENAEIDSEQVYLWRQCLGRFEECNDLSIDYCAKLYYWCLPGAKAMPCVVNYPNDGATPNAANAKAGPHAELHADLNARKSVV